MATPTSTQRPGMHHGVVERGLNSTVHSRLHEGRFGRMFRTLAPATFDVDDLRRLAIAMTADPEIDAVTLKPKVTSETEIDDEENFGIPAGYTYFGQFVDHDITFDPMSSLIKMNDPDGLVDFRTPALDLDNVYGRGPDDQPYMYDDTGRKFLLGDRSLTANDPGQVLTKDLPRFRQRALIGDKRNDENVIVSQLQGLFLRFHNYVADQNPEASFADVQQMVRWHYQWLVLFDYLPRLVGKGLIKKILPHIRNESGQRIFKVDPLLLFFKWENFPFMPVEFSGAAYRFGHTMIRPVYRLSLGDLPPVVPEILNLEGRRMIFAPNPDDGLNGFREFPAEWGIDWSLFFETREHKLSPLPEFRNKNRVQPAYKIDTSLVSPLAALPEFSIPGTNEPVSEKQPNMLALRNLLRGMTLGLPSGQDVAKYMGINPIADDELIAGKANIDGLNPDKHKTIRECGASFENKAPLWFYILAEARHKWVTRRKDEDVEKEDPTHTRLGPVGSRIVAEVLIGLIYGDPNSFLSLDPNWQPFLGNTDAESPFDRFTMGDLISLPLPL